MFVILVHVEDVHDKSSYSTQYGNRKMGRLLDYLIVFFPKNKLKEKVKLKELDYHFNRCLYLFVSSSLTTCLEDPSCSL